MAIKRLFYILIFLVTLTACAEPAANPLEAGKSVEGQMRLTGDKPANEPLVELNGEWEFYWKQLLAPKDIQEGTGSLTGYIEMPSNWNKYLMGENELPRTGYATFVLEMTITNPHSVKGLLLPVMYSNYKLWVDDELLASSGTVGTNPEQSVPQKYTNVVYFQPQSEQVQLVLQISNYHNYAGGMQEPIRYGSASDIQARHDRSLVEQAVLLGIMLMSGIYHTALSLFRKKDRSIFFFGLFCLSVGFRNILIGEVFLTKLIPSFPWEIAMKLEYITLYAVVPLMALFIQGLLPEESSGRFTRSTVIVALVYTLLTLVLDADQYYRILIFYQGFIVFGLVYAVKVSIQSLLRRREGAMLALIGFTLLILTCMYDILQFVFQYPEQSVVYPLGVSAFIVCFSLILSRKLSFSFKMTEQLAQELTSLNEGLDKKVHERTLAIEESNKKLERLNRQLEEWSMVDGLTGVFNRRYFDEYLNRHLVTSMNEDYPFSILLIDIDYFKLYNDTYGHIQGDGCLQEVAKVIKSSVPSSDGIAARYGGEEFSVLLPGSDKNTAGAISTSICTAVRQLGITHAQSKAADVVTVSIGAATITRKEDKSYRRVIQMADELLYKAKTNGRNQVCDGEMDV